MLLKDLKNVLIETKFNLIIANEDFRNVAVDYLNKDIVYDGVSDLARLIYKEAEVIYVRYDKIRNMLDICVEY